MAFNRPSDIVFIVAIFGMVIITAGYFVSDLTSQGYVFESNSTAYLTATKTTVVEQVGATAVNVSKEGLEKDTGQQSLDEGTIGSKALDSITKLGSATMNAGNLIEQTGKEVGIPSEFYFIVISLLVITFAVILFSWFRGATI